jgi:trimeric autotransporter adhesin
MKKIHFIILALFLQTAIVNAQEPIDLRKHYSSFQPGQIITSDDGFFNYSPIKLSSEPYDLKIIGVFKYDVKFDNPRFMPNPIQQEGCIKVLYTNENGIIKKGDLITSSSKPGVAMKATKAGMMLGIAMEDGPDADGYVMIRILIQYANPTP